MAWLMPMRGPTAGVAGGGVPSSTMAMPRSGATRSAPSTGGQCRHGAVLTDSTPPASTALAPPAAADPIDYVMMLDDEGVYYASMTDVIDLGKFTCRLLRSGAPVPVALGTVSDAGYAPFEVGIIVYAAGSTMCPDVLPTIESWAARNQGGDVTSNAPVSLR